MMKHSLVVRGLLLAVVCAASTANAANANNPQTADIQIHATVAPSCSISATPIEFNTYDPASTTDKLSTGNVILTCVKGSKPTVSLTDGLNPDGAQRRLLNAVTNDYLPYSLFKPVTADPAIDLPNTACAGNETLDWGVVEASRLHPQAAPSADPFTYNICAVIRAGYTNASTGDYTDTVTAEIHF